MTTTLLITLDENEHVESVVPTFDPDESIPPITVSHNGSDTFKIDTPSGHSISASFTTTTTP